MADEFEGVDWTHHAKAYWDEQPHPLEPSLKIKDFAAAVKLASMAKFGGHASPAEAGLFWPQFQATGMSPQEFEHTLDKLAPLSFTYHGRPPSMHEIAQLKDKQPHEARRYFADLPDKTYPMVSAGDMMKSLRSANPHSQEHLGRPAVLHEAQYLHFSGENPAEYYQRLAAQSPAPESTIPSSDNVLPIKERGNAPGRGVAALGGSPTDQRAANR